MAHLNADRGQLILVAAFLLAMTFVILALVVNSAIFTENLATRNDVPGSHDALEYRAELQSTVGSALTAVNRNSSNGQSDLVSIVENISTAGTFHQATQGRLVNLSFDQVDQDGTKIAQDNATRNFTSYDSPADDWAVTDSTVQQIRNFRINLTDAEATNPFAVVANNTEVAGEEWRMEISEDSGSVTVAVSIDGSPAGECTRSHDGDTIVDITAGTVAGEPCLPLGQRQDDSGTEQWFATTFDDDYRLEFENGDRLWGTYSLVVAGNHDNGSNLRSSQQGDQPYAVDAIYSVTVDYEFYTSSIGYETAIRVAPGEVPT